MSTRRHNVAGPRVMVRATVGIEASRPSLMLVPRRRRATHLAVLVSVTVGLAMLGAAAFQTQLAKRQLVLDQLDDRIGQSHAHYESLRLSRSQLRSPERLAGIAEANGMKTSNDTGFRTVSPEVELAVQQSTGMITQRDIPYGEALLDEYRVVKALGEAIP
ncbi:MAG: hypothetical protein WEB78_12175 [Ilumatobacteraceae bacterium]